MTRLLLLVLLASCLGCAAERPARTVERNPANPEAPEAPAPPLPEALSNEEAPASQEPATPQEGGGNAHLHHGAGAHAAGAPDAGVSVYTCPTHPEVRQDQPGRCPTCGMELVPAEPQDGGVR